MTGGLSRAGRADRFSTRGSWRHEGKRSFRHFSIVRAACPRKRSLCSALSLLAPCPSDRNEPVQRQGGFFGSVSPCLAFLLFMVCKSSSWALKKFRESHAGSRFPKKTLTHLDEMFLFGLKKGRKKTYPNPPHKTCMVFCARNGKF